MDFHFGSTPECVEFFKRNQTFHPLFDQLMMLTNDCFGREYIPEDRTERICFHLGETCRDDYLEILFLVVNGYGIGGAKLLRGLYERTVALAYTIKHREKAERVFRFAAIQEYKVLVAALEIVSEEQFNEAANGLNTVAEIKRRREEVVP